ncbi:hypothetical protein D3C78_789030 [compost metagenome]
MRNRCFNQVLQHRQMREQVEILEYIPDVDALFEDLFLFQLVKLVALTAIANVVTVDLDKPFIDTFQVVNGA